MQPAYGHQASIWSVYCSELRRLTLSPQLREPLRVPLNDLPSIQVILSHAFVPANLRRSTSFHVWLKKVAWQRCYLV